MLDIYKGDLNTH